MNPNQIATRAGNVTERVMTRVRQKLPEMDVPTYNRIYEAVAEEMAFQFPPSSGVVLNPSGGGMFINQKRR